MFIFIGKMKDEILNTESSSGIYAYGDHNYLINKVGIKI
mgnify:CR=1 FL=1